MTCLKNPLLIGTTLRVPQNLVNHFLPPKTNRIFCAKTKKQTTFTKTCNAAARTNKTFASQIERQ